MNQSSEPMTRNQGGEVQSEKKVDTPKKVDDILKEGLPHNDDVIRSLPFGKYIVDACEKPDEGEGNRKHFGKVVAQMNALLAGRLEEIDINGSPEDTTSALGGWIAAWENMYGPRFKVDDEEMQMWRLEAYLHDVGKAFHKSKHPTRGLWLISHLASDENRRVRSMYGEHKFRQLQRVIASHDRFGVIATGEASFAILADMLDRGTTASDINKVTRDIFHVLVLNVIDASTYFDDRLPSDRLADYLSVWNKCCVAPDSPLQQSKGDRAVFERLLIDLAWRTEHTIDRLAFLLKESYRGCSSPHRERSEFDPPLRPLAQIDFRQLASEALHPETGYRFDDFRVDFAFTIKFDYLLSLTMEIVSAYMTNKREMGDLAVCLVSAVKKLHDQFSNLIRRGDRRYRIGVDLSALQSTPEVRKRIATLLSGPLAGLSYGLEWLAEEATAYPFP